MIQESSRWNYDEELYEKVSADKYIDSPTCGDRSKEDKAVGKQKVVEGKEASKTSNLYVEPMPMKYFKCNQLGHKSTDYPLRKAINVVEQVDDDEVIFCGPDGNEEKIDNEEEVCMVQRFLLSSK